MYFQEILILSLIILVIATFIDLILGELPKKIHPVVFIGKIIDLFLKYLIEFKNKISGFFLTLLVSIFILFFFSVILWISSYNIILFVIVSSILLSSTFSINMLLSSANSIKDDLDNDIESARKSMSYLVSRNTLELDEPLIISATIETLSENITDSVISPIFYYILATILFILAISIDNIFNLNFFNFFSNNLTINIIFFAVLVSIFYRIINTLDAMVGYKNQKYFYIGYFPAKLDDILNYLPARFGGILVVLAAFLYKKNNFNYKNSYEIMLRDARNCPSPNSGFTMAAVAGALDISLIKKGVYKIGNSDNILKKEDISNTVKLSNLTIILSILLLILIFTLFILIL